MEIINLIMHYEYLQNAYIMGILMGILAPILGAYVVIKRLGLIVDGVSHITLSGISFAMMLDARAYMAINPMYFGVIFALIGSLFIEKISGYFKNYKEIAIPIAISVSASLTALFTSLAGGFTSDLMNYLFGSILTTTKIEIAIIGATLVIVAICLRKYYYDIMSFAIDEDYCKFAGINTKNFKIGFTILIAVVISISIKAVGMMLVGSLVIIPISTASKFAKSFKSTVLFAILFSELSVLIGLVLSYYLNVPSGATIVLANLMFFVIVIIKTRRSNQ